MVAGFKEDGSLAFGRDDRPVVTYYDKTNGDLRMATGPAGHWTRRTIDSGAVGTRDVGRFSALALDPARPGETAWTVAYEDTSGARYVYGAQGNLPGGTYNPATNYTTFTVAAAAKLGGYTSLAFDAANRPAVSFYDSAISGLRYATSGRATLEGIRFRTSTVADRGAVGYYSNLHFDDSDRPTILYFDRTRSRAMHAVMTNNTWSTLALAPGGRAIHVARFNGTIAYTNLHESVPALQVLSLS